MTELSSGHGGDFELDPNDDFMPNLEFTIPIEFLVPDPSNKVSIDGEPGRAPDINWPDGISNTHPNMIPNERHPDLKRQESRSGKFETFNPFGGKSFPFERIDYTIVYANTSSHSEVAIKNDNDEVVVQFTCDQLPESYTVLVTYNFRKAEHPVVPKKHLTFSSPAGQVDLSVFCYIYVVIATHENPDPQNDGITSVAAEELFINATKLIELMTQNPKAAASSDLAGSNLYYTPADEINNQNLGEKDWDLEVVRVAAQDAMTESGDITFTLVPENFSPEENIPLGLYIFGKPVPVQAEHVQSGDLVNINNADKEMLDGLLGIGPALADEIIKERSKVPFTYKQDIKRVNGIGAVLYKHLENKITT